MKKMLAILVMMVVVVMSVSARQARVENLVYEGADGTTVYLSDGIVIRNIEAVTSNRFRLNHGDIIDYEVRNGRLAYIRNLTWERNQPGAVSYNYNRNVDPYGNYYGGGYYGGGYYGSSNLSFSVGGKNGGVGGNINLGEVVGTIVNIASAKRAAKQAEASSRPVATRSTSASTRATSSSSRSFRLEPTETTNTSATTTTPTRNRAAERMAYLGY